MSEPVIRVENLSKKYIIGQQKQEKYSTLRDLIANGTKSVVQTITNSQARANNNQEEFWALKDVSFEIKQGDRVGIIGRNGAGKSTLLKILSRITEPTKGRINIQGRVASLLEVGTGFHPELTGRENIFLNGAILGMSKVEIKKKFDEIVAFAEIEKFLDTPVKRYSSGMYVRLAFAVAAHLEPEILVVDEVLAVGDSAFQKKCLGKMEEVGKEGRTVLFVSHNISAIETLCNSGILLDKGKVIDTSKINSCLARYTNLIEINSKNNAHLGPIKSVFIKSNEKLKYQKIETNDNIKIFIELDSQYDFENNHSILIRIFSLTGENLFTAETQPGELTQLSKADHLICLSIDKLPLNPHEYKLGVGLMNYGIGPIYWDSSVQFFRVSHKNNEKHSNKSHSKCLLSIPYSWVVNCKV